MKTIEEVVDKIKHYDRIKNNPNIAGDTQKAFCEGVIQALGWAYNLPYWDMEALNEKR